MGAVIDKKTSKAVKNMAESFSIAGKVVMGFSARLGAGLFSAGQKAIEVTLAMAESVRTGNNVLGYMIEKEEEAEQAAFELEFAQIKATASAQAMAKANSYLTNELDRQVPTVNQLLKLYKVFRTEEEKRLKVKEEAIKKERQLFMQEKELQVIRLQAVGKNEEATALQKKIDLFRRSVEMSEKYNITLKEAARLTRAINEQQQVKTQDKPAAGSPQANFLRAKASGTITPELIKKAEEYAASIGTTFDAETGYARPSDLINKIGRFKSEDKKSKLAASEGIATQKQMAKSLQTIEREFTKTPTFRICQIHCCQLQM